MNLPQKKVISLEADFSQFFCEEIFLNPV